MSLQIILVVNSLLEEWQEMNPGSMADWFVDNDNLIEHVLICPHYT